MVSFLLRLVTWGIKGWVVKVGTMACIYWLAMVVVYFNCNWAGLWEVLLNVVFSL